MPVRFIIAYDVYIEYKLKTIDPYPKKSACLTSEELDLFLTNSKSFIFNF